MRDHEKAAAEYAASEAVDRFAYGHKVVPMFSDETRVANMAHVREIARAAYMAGVVSVTEQGTVDSDG